MEQLMYQESKHRVALEWTIITKKDKSSQELLSLSWLENFREKEYRIKRRETKNEWMYDLKKKLK